MIVKTNGCNAENPTLAEVVAGGSSTQQQQQIGGNSRGVGLASNDSNQGERHQDVDHGSQPAPALPGVFVIPADQRRKQKRQLQRENRSKQLWSL